ARVNLLSAVCDAAAASLLFAAVRIWTGSAPPGVLSGLGFAFSPLVWRYAIQAEVFALNNLFAAALVLVSVLLAAPSPRPAVAIARAFALALSLPNHHTLVLFSVPFLGHLHRRRPLPPKKLAVLALPPAAGRLPSLYLPCAAARAAPVSWGDAASLGGFLDHVLRREYGTFRLAHEATGQGGELLPRVFLFV